MRWAGFADFTLACIVVLGLPSSASATEDGKTEDGKTEDGKTEEKLLDQISEELAAGPPAARARGGVIVWSSLAGGADSVDFDHELEGKSGGAEVSVGLGYRLGWTAILDLRGGVTLGYSKPGAINISGSRGEVTSLTMTTVGAELVARAHLTRLSHVFLGVGPRTTVRMSTAEVDPNPAGRTPRPSEVASSTWRKTDVGLGPIFELGVELGKERRIEVTTRTIWVTRPSPGTTLFSVGFALGYVF